MHKDSIQKQILYISSMFFICIAIVFLGLIPLSTSYVYGWIFSSGISLIGYLFGLWIIEITIKSKRKRFARVMNYVRIFILYVLHIIAIIILIWVDNNESKLTILGRKGMESLYEPINIFTYIGAIAVIPISTFIAHIPSKKGR